jgi:chromosome segregation ATPase
LLNSTSDLGGVFPVNCQNGAADQNVDVTAELDALLNSLELATPHPSPPHTPLSGAVTDPEASRQLQPRQVIGGFEQIQSILSQLETAHHALEIDRQQATAAQATISESLQAIQARVATQSQDLEQKLRQYHESVQSLSQTISTDRLQLAGMGVEMSAQLNNFHDLHDRVTTTHAQIVETSHTLQSKVTEIERGFVSLIQSVRVEKNQFAALTAETIAKADTIHSQLADIVKQIGGDPHAVTQPLAQTIATLQADVEALRKTVRHEAQQKLINFDLRDRELISLCTKLQARQKLQAANARKFSIWLAILSGVLGVTLLLLIRVFISLK